MSRYGHYEAGKGARRRPSQVPDEELARRWEAVFKKPSPCEDCPIRFVCKSWLKQ